MRTLICILLFFVMVVWFFGKCAKEKSCEGEGCGGNVPPVIIDTIPIQIDTTDTVKEYLVYYNIPVDSNYLLSHIEPEFKSKYRDFYDFYIIGKESDDSSYIFIGEYDVIDPMD